MPVFGNLPKRESSDLGSCTRILKDNLEQEQRVVLEMTQKMQEAHEKEVHAHQQLSELQAFDKDHDYWPQVLKKKDEVSACQQKSCSDYPRAVKRRGKRGLVY